MSAILAVCGEAFCCMVSDGRMVEEPMATPPKILTETLPKVRKVNHNILVGFAGDAVAAAQIINSLDEYETAYLTLDKAIKVLQEKAQQVQCLPLGVRLLVGGRNRKGGFQLTSLGSENGYQPQTQPARANAMLIEGACSHTNVEPFLRQVKAAAPGWKTMEEIAATLDDAIRAIAAQDATVNTEFFRQRVI